MKLNDGNEVVVWYNERIIEGLDFLKYFSSLALELPCFQKPVQYRLQI